MRAKAGNRILVFQVARGATWSWRGACGAQQGAHRGGCLGSGGVKREHAGLLAGSVDCVGLLNYQTQKRAPLNALLRRPRPHRGRPGARSQHGGRPPRPRNRQTGRAYWAGPARRGVRCQGRCPPPHQPHSGCY